MKYLVPVVIIILCLLGINGIYVISQGHAAVLTRFGHVEDTGIGPGLHFKVPFLQHVSIYDTRAILTQSEPEDYKTSGGQSVRVDYYVRWQVADPNLYFNATSGEGSQVSRQMTPVIRAALRDQVAAHHLSALLAEDGGGIDDALRAAVAAKLRQRLGVTVLDVGVRRVMPPDDALPAVYKRMSAGAKAQADAIRAEGEAAAAAIRAKGDAANQAVLAAANKAAAAERGQGVADAAKLYAQAAAKDPAFFRYWSSLSTWRESFSGGGAVVVLDKDSPFMQAIDEGAAGVAPVKKH